jgi:hypothetical protein
MHGPTRNPPFPDACRTGRLFITICCMASTHEFEVDGALCSALPRLPRRGPRLVRTTARACGEYQR